jgi:hypothetical protein
MGGFKTKEAQRIYNQIYMDRDREAWNRRGREYYHATKHDPNKKVRRRKYEYEKKFNLTIEQYDEMLRQQDYKCAICRRDTPNKKQNTHWAVDHDHTTGKVRGLLCQNCNQGLGKFKDNKILLEEAIKYLQK